MLLTFKYFLILFEKKSIVLDNSWFSQAYLISQKNRKISSSGHA